MRRIPVYVIFLLRHRENGSKVDDVKEGSRIKILKRRSSEGGKMNNSGEMAARVVKLPTFLLFFRHCYLVMSNLFRSKK